MHERTGKSSDRLCLVFLLKIGGLCLFGANVSHHYDRESLFAAGAEKRELQHRRLAGREHDLGFLCLATALNCCKMVRNVAAGEYIVQRSLQYILERLQAHEVEEGLVGTRNITLAVDEQHDLGVQIDHLRQFLLRTLYCPIHILHRRHLIITSSQHQACVARSHAGRGRPPSILPGQRWRAWSASGLASRIFWAAFPKGLNGAVASDAAGCV